MATDEERELEKLFAAYVDRLNEGEELDAEKILIENPVFGVDIIAHVREHGKLSK